MSNNIFAYIEYLKQFPLNKSAKEFWKVFKIRGGIDNRHLSFNVCKTCTDRVFKDKEKLKVETDKDSNISCLVISFRLCEECIDRNVFETNSYIYKYAHKRRSQANTISIEIKNQTNGDKEPSTSKKL